MSDEEGEARRRRVPRKDKGELDDPSDDEDGADLAPRAKRATTRTKATARVVDEDDDDGGDNGDDNDDEERAVVARPKRAKPKAGRRRRSSNDDDDDDDGNGDDDDEEGGAGGVSVPKRGKSRGIVALSPGGPDREGIIEEITVTNFMCHEKLHIVLGPQINFITGPNGSGKSALLLALSLCLGASAAFTQRGHRNASFVRKGAHKAVIAVRLCNRGAEAYKADKYGHSIVIERTLTPTTSSYKFRNYETREVVSTDRVELQGICDQFGIQISNPCIIMMQETSREFLGSSSPARKYELFEKATQIRQIEDSLEALMSHIAAASDTLNRKMELKPKLESQYAQCRKEHEQIVHLKMWKEEIRGLKGQLVWAQVAEQEKNIETLEARLTENRGVLERNEAKMKKFDEKRALRMTEDTALAADLKGVSEAIDALSQDALERDEALATLRRKKGDLERRAVGFPRKIEMLGNRIARLDEELARAMARAGDDDAEQRARLAQLAQLKDSVRQLDGQLEDTKSELEMKRVERQRQRDQADRNAGELRQVTKERDGLVQQLAVFDAAAQNEDARFGADIPRIKALIAANAKRFTRVPRGPLGALLKLQPDKVQHKDFDASKAAEMLVSKIMGNFWCDSQADSRALKDLLREHKMRFVNTVVLRFRDAPYSDVHTPPAHPDYVRVLDCFVFDPPDAANVVVDLLGVESAVIVREADGGYQLAYDLLKGRNVAHLSRVSLADGTVRSKAAQGIKTMPPPYNTTFLLSKPANQRKEVEARRRAADARLDTLQQMQRGYERDARAADEAIARLEKQLYDGQDKLNRLRERVREIEQPLPGAVESTETQDKKAELEKSLAQLQSEEREIKAQINVTRLELEDAERGRARVQGELDELGAKRAGLAESTKELRKSVQELTRKFAKSEKQMAQFRASLDSQQLALDAARVQLHTDTAKAREGFPERVAASRPVAELEAVVAAREEAIRRQTAHTGKTVEEIEREYVTIKRRLRTVTTELDALQAMLVELSRGLKAREKRLTRLRTVIGHQVSLCFNMQLTQRGYEGSAQFTHDRAKPQLEVHVNLNPQSQASQSQDVASLSGGETSFATVSLLLAMWEAMEPPFRILDEFDIFMDDLHRKKTIEMLIEFAKVHTDRQFVFLSPLDTTAIPKNDPAIRIKELEPPRRDPNQPRINEML